LFQGTDFGLKLKIKKKIFLAPGNTSNEQFFSLLFFPSLSFLLLFFFFFFGQSPALAKVGVARQGCQPSSASRRPWLRSAIGQKEEKRKNKIKTFKNEKKQKSYTSLPNVFLFFFFILGI